jgi:hypothetical protein
MAFTNHIPQANDQLSISQGQLLGNFEAIAPLVGGIFAVQAAAGLGTAATELAIYNRNDGLGVPQLYFRRQGIAPGGADIPFTVVSNTGAHYTAILPSGIIVKFWRGAVGPGTNDFNLAYDANYPLTTLFYRTASYDFAATASPATVVTATALDYTAGLQTVGIRISIRPAQTAAGRFCSYLAIGN